MRQTLQHFPTKLVEKNNYTCDSSFITTPTRELYESKYDVIKILTKKYLKEMATNKNISTFKTETVSATKEVG